MMHRFLTRAAAAFDRAINTALTDSAKRGRRPKSDPESLGHADRIRILSQIQGIYDRPEHFAAPSPFFPEPGPITPLLTPVRVIPGGRVADATWPSESSLHCNDVAERYLRHKQNGTAAARLFLHADSPRPAAILVHGYRCGQFALEERIWPIRWLFERGLDVALFVLPFHAVRAVRRGPPSFPSNDPRVTNERFRQAIFDLRALSRFLLSRGSPSIGVMGMSLGGYTISLFATIDEGLSFVVPIIPMASIADIARNGGRFVGTDEEKALQHQALEAVHRVISPLARPARVTKDRILVVGAAGDQITPLDQAQKLSTHFDAPLEVIHGGHLLQFGRRGAFRAVGRLLGGLGLLHGPRAQPSRAWGG
jgi:dienelactone hydrolase